MRVALLALLALAAIPAAAAEDKPLPPPTKEQLAASAENLKWIVVAFHNFADANSAVGKKIPHLPNNMYTKEGKPLLSWRVMILGYLDRDPADRQLFKAFALDEPWDSPKNKKLIAEMPRIYEPIRVKAKPGETFYRGFVGKGAPFGRDKGHDGWLGLNRDSITDGLDNTGLIYEAGEPVIWTKPDDLEFDPKKPLPKFGGMFDGEFHVGFPSGSVHLFRRNPDEKELRKVIQYDDGQEVNFKKLLVIPPE
jgi:hypothetical protein